jgi:hypothetical protein
VIRSGSHVEFSGFDIHSSGHGIWVGSAPYLGGGNSYRFDNDLITTSPGAGLVFDNNIIGAWVNNTTITGPSAAGLSPIWITGTAWNSLNNCCMYFNDITTVNRGLRADGPGGGIGSGSYYFTNWINEALTASDTALIIHDNGPNAPGISSTTPLLNVSIHNLNNSDPVNGPAAYTVFQELGTTQGISSVDLNQVNSFGRMLSCGPNTTICNDRPFLSAHSTNSSSLGGTWGGEVLASSSDGKWHGHL